jgi:hypothetical protein
MLTVHTTEDFAAWFRALGDREAEEVATGIELIAGLGPERAPPASSDLLLWYQCPSAGRYYGAEMVEFAARARRVVEHLGSVTTRARLAEVSAERAERAARSIARIGTRTRQWRLGLGARDDRARQGLVKEYRAALEALDLTEPKPAAPPQMLRELNLPRCEPGIRLLYGVDAPSARALVILGETLEQFAYGPSVRRALSVWRQFLTSGAEAGVVAAGSSK